MAHANISLGWAVVAMAFAFHWTAATAGVLLGGTRVILDEGKREASISVKNTGGTPYVVQAWIDAGDGKNKAPFMVTPPLSRLDPGKENKLRILRVPARLPGDRESVFWLNVKEIPEKSGEENVLQLAVRSRIKLFYRPSGLAGKALEARERLRWAVGTDDSGVTVLRIANPTPYHVTLTSLNINEGQQAIDADMLAPFSELVYPLAATETPQQIQISFSTVNDYGGVTAKEMVMVPVADKPVALDAAASGKPAAATGR